MSLFTQQHNGILWSCNHELMLIEPWGRDSIRVRATQLERLLEMPGALLPAEGTPVSITIGEHEATLRNGRLSAVIAADGGIRFMDAKRGTELAAEERPRHLRRFTALSHDTYRIEARFTAYDDERCYGLGQHTHGYLDQKGCVIELRQMNTQVSIPFLLSSRGYGLLWHNPALGRVELGKNGTRWVADAAPQLDYWVTTGERPADIMARYAEATGHPLLLPEWAAGFWQSRMRYRTQEELLAVAREHHRRGLPMSVIVIDFFHWTMMGEWRFDPVAWPDPEGMVRELEAMGIKVMVSVWPTVNINSAHYAEMTARGLITRNERGFPAHLKIGDSWPAGEQVVQFYDATHPDARAYLWEQVRENYHRLGIKIWWLDACEPEIYPVDHDNLRYHLGSGATVGNIYPLLHAQGFYDGMTSAGETEILTLCRCAWAGSQRFGAAVWSGDISSTFATLQAQVRAGLNIAMSGIPWWTTDIGGFLHGHPDDPAFRELIVRWFQYGVFCPLFRLHGARDPIIWEGVYGGPNEVWSFGEEAYEIIRDLLLLRERLRPYIMAQMQLAHQTGLPPMRPLFFDFPHDPICATVEDAFLFGPDLLVAPVLDAGARTRKVYLPAGAAWRDAWSGACYPGGQWIHADAPLERIPLYLRDEAELPIVGDKG